MTVRLVHPSAIILKELRARRWSREILARRLVEAFPERYRDVVDEAGRTHLGLDIAILSLDMYLNVGPKEPGLRMGETASEFDRVFGVGDGFFARLEEAWLAHA